MIAEVTVAHREIATIGVSIHNYMNNTQLFRKNYISGFTLIELVVVTAVMLGIAGFGSAAYLNFNERQVMELAQKEVKNNLRLAKQKALSGEKDSTACGTEPLSGWCVSPDNADDQTYRIYGTCGSDETLTYTPFPASPLEFKLPNGVKLEVRAKTASGWEGNYERIRFDSLGSGITLRDTNLTQVTYCLEGTLPSLGTQNKYAITVDQTGEIIDEGFTSNCFL